MKKLYLSSTDQKLVGVCGGIGEYYSVDPTLIRLGWVVVTLVTGIFPGVIAYVLAMILIPRKDEDKASKSE